MAILQELGPDSTLGEILEVYPGARRALFKRYHLGGCSSCGFREDETLAQLCARSGGLDPKEVLQSLEQCHAEDQAMMIEPRDLAEAMKSGPVRLLDIRTAEEYAAVHIEGAHHFNQELMNEILSKWPRHELMVIMDHTGARSLDAAAYFAGHGFENVKSLRGGIDAWSVEVDPSLPRYTLE